MARCHLLLTGIFFPILNFKSTDVSSITPENMKILRIWLETYYTTETSFYFVETGTNSRVDILQYPHDFLLFINYWQGFNPCNNWTNFCFRYFYLHGIKIVFPKVSRPSMAIILRLPSQAGYNRPLSFWRFAVSKLCVFLHLLLGTTYCCSYLFFFKYEVQRA